MDDQDAARIAGFKEAGEAAVRDRVNMGREGGYNEHNRALAIAWLARLDQEKEAASLARTEAHNSALTDSQRRTAEATEAAAAAARASASEAATANELARAANNLASSANALASRASNRARDANKIAIAAMVISTITAIAAIAFALLRGAA